MYTRHPGDDLLKDDPRLKYDWDWSRIASGISKGERDKWTHFQCSECSVGKWTLEASQWGRNNALVYYESRIEYLGNTIASVGHHRDEKIRTSTRIEAQIRAEALLIDWITEEYNLIIQKKK